ncbi:MAG: response regulator [Gammaproteobacteria bacterium]|nr:MAG: response regulator [Gammaproteobacteria bacterium]
MSKILIVDDSASIRQLALFTLKSKGFEVESANDGKQALDELRNSHYDLVLTDRNMPVLDGIELAKEVRGIDEYKSIPIIMLTTESDSDKKQEGKAAGVTGWIIKPFNPETLVKTINKVLD